MDKLQPSDIAGKFKDLHDVPYYPEVGSCEAAIDRLFEGKAENLCEHDAKGGELYISYTALYKGKKCFIKIIREDNPYSKNIFYSYEWKLKENLSQYGWLDSVGAELVVPDKGAVFKLQGQLYYLTSYEYVHGATLVELYRDYIIASRYFQADSKRKKLLQSFRRCGQVLAAINHNPDAINGDTEMLFKQPVRLLLSDRNGTNEIYDAASDRFYLIDLSEEECEGNKGDVYSSLKCWLDNLTDLNIHAQKKYGSGKRSFSHLFVDLLEAFIEGYTDTFPIHDHEKLSLMIKSMVRDDLKEICQDESWLESFANLIG